MDIDEIDSDQEERAKAKSFYHSLPKSYKEDVIDDTYRIHTDRPVSELSNQFCRYYFATHIESEKEYFAIVFDNNFMPPIADLSRLKNSQCPSINNLLAYSLVKLGISKKFSLYAIVKPYNPQENLQHYIEKNGTMTSEEIEKQLAPSINNALSYCETHKLNCNNICPSNILIDKDGNIKVREFFTLPSFNQAQAYLAPEIADALPYGRRVFGVASDIYSFGMSIYFALSGETPNFSSHESKLHNVYRLEIGTYEGAIAKKRIPRRIKTLLAWTLKDNPEERWSVIELAEWQTEKKEFSLPKPKPTTSYTTLFVSHNYSNPAALASAMYNLYDEGTKFCRDDLFLKWTQKTKGKTEYVEDFVHMQVQQQTVRGMTQGEMDESFFRILKQLDPNSPYIRLKDFCITIASIPDIIYEAVDRESASWSERLIKIFKNNFYGLLEVDFKYAPIPIEYSEKLTEIATNYTDKLYRPSFN